MIGEDTKAQSFSSCHRIELFCGWDYLKLHKRAYVYIRSSVKKQLVYRITSIMIGAFLFFRNHLYTAEFFFAFFLF